MNQEKAWHFLRIRRRLGISYELEGFGISYESGEGLVFLVNQEMDHLKYQAPSGFFNFKFLSAANFRL